MKRSKRTVVVFMVALLVICTALVALTACNQSYDPETRPFSMSISTPDGVFNPFFSTSAYDSSIISLTQIGMLNTDREGKIIYGENEPTVVKDMTETKKENGNTVYKFLIKNGIKWSDGEPLTIKDVLFNLYVYLDPAYTGSATIYSTDIIGLQNYRLQSDNEEVLPGEVSAFEKSFAQKANSRIDEDIDYLKFYGAAGDDEITLPDNIDEIEPRIIEDYARYAKAFLEELQSDWNNINVEDYDWRNKEDMSAADYNEYGKYILTDKWEVFLLNDAQYSFFYKRNPETGGFAKYDGNALIDKEETRNTFIREILPELLEKELATEIGNINDDDYDYDLKDDTEEERIALDKAISEICINAVFSTNFSRFFPMEVITRESDKFEVTEDDMPKLIKSIENTRAKNFENIALYWATGDTMRAQFTAEAKSSHFASNDKAAKTITGITTEKVTQFNGQNYGSEQFDVLSIEIKGVDPKAIYNFAFNVSPLHYYSTHSWSVNSNTPKKDYIAAALADDAEEKGEFGLEFGSATFMNEVINAFSKVNKPVGAGAYMAHSTLSFFDDNLVNYERNPYFYTVGSGLSNAKIKYVRYKVVASDQIIGGLSSENIDFGDPSATQANISLVKGAKKLTYNLTDTNGYGYVGINPRFVPDITVRRAIMKAMDAQSIKQNYYQGDLCTIINRPMSTTNWAYPKGATVYKYNYTYPNSGKTVSGDYSYDATGYVIKEMLEEAGYTLNKDGVLHKVIGGGIDDVIDYKFTIAGGSTDHPAYSMFLNAARILNSIGCNVRVVTSLTALTDLSAGKLEVWAAAWSSSIDPDMYQVYHMDSQASSTKNWGYAQILGQTNADAWGDEYVVVERLSKLIDEGRNTTVEKDRKDIYSRALDTIMEMAVEFPTYQRKDMSVYNSKVIDAKTLTPEKELSHLNGLLSRIWEVNYK